MAFVAPRHVSSSEQHVLDCKNLPKDLRQWRYNSINASQAGVLKTFDLYNGMDWWRNLEPAKRRGIWRVLFNENPLAMALYMWEDVEEVVDFGAILGDQSVETRRRYLRFRSVDYCELYMEHFDAWYNHIQASLPNVIRQNWLTGTEHVRALDMKWEAVPTDARGIMHGGRKARR